MRCLKIDTASIAHPTGDPTFAVLQPFPSAIPPEESDPFLMCDEIGPKLSSGVAKGPDDFPVNWHPHVGMDIMSYYKQGRGRHGDSLGNRTSFTSPGFQWCSVGSGIEHAEGGGTPAGEPVHGFQIWINVPAERKGDDPRYGTEPPENIPVVEDGGVRSLVLAGEHGGAVGPFRTAQPVQMVDLEIAPEAEYMHRLPVELDNCMLYVYRGSGRIGGRPVKEKQIALLDAGDALARDAVIHSGAEGIGALVFAGKRIREKIVWHGPLVLNSKTDIKKAFISMQTGQFPPVRVPWDYKRLAAFPAEARLDDDGAQGARGDGHPDPPRAGLRALVSRALGRA